MKDLQATGEASNSQKKYPAPFMPIAYLLGFTNGSRTTLKERRQQHSRANRHRSPRTENHLRTVAGLLNPLIFLYPLPFTYSTYLLPGVGIHILGADTLCADQPVLQPTRQTCR